MANWIYFVLIAHTIWTFTSFLDKIVISKGHIKNPLVYITLNGAMNIFVILLLPFVKFEMLKFWDILIVLFSGSTLTISVILYYKAINHDEVTRIRMMGQLAPIFVLITSFVFLGEVLTKRHLAGFFLLLFAGILVSYRNEKKSFRISKAFYFMLAASFLDGFGIVAAKHIFSITNFWNAFIWLRLSGFTALAVLLLPSIRNQFSETFGKMKTSLRSLLGFKMIVDFSAFVFSGYALMSGPASLTTVLSSSVSPLFMLILVLITSKFMPQILKEDFGKKSILIKLSAIVLIMIGIVFVSS